MSNDEEYVIDPHRDVGPLRFGMTRAEVRKALDGEEPHVIDRRDRGGELLESFREHDRVQVIYDADERAAAVQFPIMDRVMYPPKVRMKGSYNKILQWAKEQGPALIQELRSFQSDALGLAVGARTPKGGKLEHVLVYRPRYYEDARRHRAEVKARQRDEG